MQSSIHNSDKEQLQRREKGFPVSSKHPFLFNFFGLNKLKLTDVLAGVTDGHANEKIVWGFSCAFIKFAYCCIEFTTTYRQGNINDMKPHYSQVETGALDRQLTVAPL